MTGTLTTGQAFPVTSASVVPASAEVWASGAQIVRFTGAFHPLAGGSVGVDLPLKLSRPVKDATMILHLELASTGVVSGALRYRDAEALVDAGGLVRTGYYSSTGNYQISLLPALTEAPVTISFWGSSTWVEAFADRSVRSAAAIALADGRWLLHRLALERDKNGVQTGISSLSAVFQFTPFSPGLQGSATSGNSLRGVVSHSLSGAPY
jgi:hypothetical protein